MNLRLRSKLASLAVVAGLLAGCGDSSTTTSPSTTGAAAFPATVQSASGSVTVPARPTRVVSLSPTATEDLYAIGAGSQVVAVDDQSNYPAEAPRTSLSGFTPNVEAILGYKPDLVIISYDTNGLKDTLTRASIPVLLQPSATSLDDAYSQIAQLGTATGNTQQSTDAVNNIKSRISAAVAKAPATAKGKRIYHEVDSTYYSATSKSFVGSIYALYGLTNVADAADSTGSGFPQLSSEYIVKSDPQYIFLADSANGGQSERTLAARPGWADITAIKTHKVVPLNDDVASRWGPRVVELVEAVGTAVAS